MVVEAGAPSPKIFVLGDSRTGTLALHNFFLKQGLRSIHYYVGEAGISDPIHEAFELNEAAFLKYVADSRNRAFTDYPTRSFFRALYDRYPDAYFILTYRESTERWLASMRSFLGKFRLEFDEVEHRVAYEEINNQIRVLFSGSDRKFIEICIDADNLDNSLALAHFLGLDPAIRLSRDNKTADVGVTNLSSRRRLYSGEEVIDIGLLERMIAPSKALLSEFGWMFLANDTNDFLHVQFDGIAWTNENRARASDVIRTRLTRLAADGISYFKFIIPEKSVVYREYLPKAVQNLASTKQRPAQMLSEDNPEIVHYLDEYLTDAKSYGLVYFRGDSHTNWLGAWFVYRYIIELLRRQLGPVITEQPLTLADLTPTIATYDGDLWAQANEEFKQVNTDVLGFTSAKYGFELTVSLGLLAHQRRATRVDTPLEYVEWFTSRETFVFERADGVGPRAVIFRDSTLDLCLELIAEHFSRCVFVWHNGLVYDEIIAREKPHIVLHAMAERFTTRYLVFPTFAQVPSQGE